MDWRTIGYEDGLHGHPPERIAMHRAACGKHQVSPNLASYTEGRKQGLLEYCQARNGFRVGLNGYPYAHVCAGAVETAFIDNYRIGRQIYDARAELRSTEAQLRGARSGLMKTDAAMQSVTAELVGAKVTTERRVYLAQELVRLTEQRTDLEQRIDQLAVRTQELAVGVRELERRSPYPL